SRVFVFLDSGTCDSGSFYICPFGYGYPSESVWWNSPGDWHHRGSNLSFADGHVEYHHWKWPKSVDYGVAAANSADVADLRWLQAQLPECEEKKPVARHLLPGRIVTNDNGY